MIVPSTPDARSPGPSGPDLSSPTGGSWRRAARTSPDNRPSCQRTSSLTASGRPGAARPAGGWGRGRGRGADRTSGLVAGEPAADLLSDVELASGEGAGPRDRI